MKPVFMKDKSVVAQSNKKKKPWLFQTVGFTKAHYKMRIVLNCKACVLTLIEIKKKNAELEMNRRKNFKSW